MHLGDLGRTQQAVEHYAQDRGQHQRDQGLGTRVEVAGQRVFANRFADTEQDIAEKAEYLAYIL